MIVKYGFDGTLNLNSGTYGTPTWVAVSASKDHQVTADMDEFDATTRQGGGIKQSEPTLLALALGFKVRTDQSDTAGYVVLEAAFLTRGVLDTLVLDGGVTVNGSRGYRADMKVFKFGEDQAVGNILHREVELKPCASTNAAFKAVVASGAPVFTSLAM